MTRSTTVHPELDVLVIGSGVAGLSAAVRAASAHRLRVGVLTKGVLHQTATRWAQGGVAAVLGGDPDSTDLHLADTLKAGAGLCDIDAVRVLVDEGPMRVNSLIAMGAMFDRMPDGDFSLAREGGHTHARILHADGAATGAEIERALVVAVHDTAALLLEHSFADRFLVEGGRCVGVSYRTEAGEQGEVRAKHVLLAAGGAGQLFAVTTNPLVATGDGIAMAIEAGAAVADLEFIQFHPTALHHPSMPRPLLSEALRGHGALLRNTAGERFVDELQPRDIVARAIMGQMLTEGAEAMFLDATGLDDFEVRFPNIHAVLAGVGLDPATDLLPVAPAAHYTCGGLLTDLDGATSLPGLWGAGEVTCSGVHGANRLASNSLLEGMVFAPRAIDAIAAGKDAADTTGAMRSLLTPDDARVGGRVVDAPASPIWAASAASSTPAEIRVAIQQSMTRGAGVFRTRESLETTAAVLEAAVSDIPGEAHEGDDDLAWAEVRNLAVVGRALVRAAISREESRGSHTREDFPDRSDAWLARQILR